MLDEGSLDVEHVEQGPSVGERLREARRSAGLTLEQVSATTRIRVPVLRELEADRLGPAGSAVYTRGHIRAVAAATGADPAPIVAAFDRQVGASAPSVVVVPEPVPAPRRPVTSLHVPVPAPPERTSPRWLMASLAGVAVLVALMAIGTLGGEDRETEPAASVPQAVTTAPPPQPAAAPPPSPAALELRATDDSWISVRNRGDVRLFEGTVEQGWAQRFEDPVALTVRVGNAAGVQGSCGSAPIAAGEEGVALTLRCTPGGLERP